MPEPYAYGQSSGALVVAVRGDRPPRPGGGVRRARHVSGRSGRPGGLGPPAGRAPPRGRGRPRRPAHRGAATPTARQLAVARSAHPRRAGRGGDAPPDPPATHPRGRRRSAGARGASPGAGHGGVRCDRDGRWRGGPGRLRGGPDRPDHNRSPDAPAGRRRDDPGSPAPAPGRQGDRRHRGPGPLQPPDRGPARGRPPHAHQAVRHERPPHGRSARCSPADDPSARPPPRHGAGPVEPTPARSTMLRGRARARQRAP